MGNNHNRDMETDKLLTALKAIEISGKAKDLTPEEILDWAIDICADKFKRKNISGAREYEPSEDDIEVIYRAYPTKDVRNNNRPTSKGEKSKRLIAKRLKEGYTKDFILKAISNALESNSYLKDFNTFLNNLPCKDDNLFSEAEFPKPIDPYHL